MTEIFEVSKAVKEVKKEVGDIKEKSWSSKTGKLGKAREFLKRSLGASVGLTGLAGLATPLGGLGALGAIAGYDIAKTSPESRALERAKAHTELALHSSKELDLDHTLLEHSKEKLQQLNKVHNELKTKKEFIKQLPSLIERFKAQMKPPNYLSKEEIRAKYSELSSEAIQHDIYLPDFSDIKKNIETKLNNISKTQEIAIENEENELLDEIKGTQLNVLNASEAFKKNLEKAKKRADKVSRSSIKGLKEERKLAKIASGKKTNGFSSLTYKTLTLGLGTTKNERRNNARRILALVRAPDQESFKKLASEYDIKSDSDIYKKAVKLRKARAYSKVSDAIIENVKGKRGLLIDVSKSQRDIAQSATELKVSGATEQSKFGFKGYRIKRRGKADPVIKKSRDLVDKRMGDAVERYFKEETSENVVELFQNNDADPKDVYDSFMELFKSDAYKASPSLETLEQLVKDHMGKYPNFDVNFQRYAISGDFITNLHKRAKKSIEDAVDLEVDERNRQLIILEHDQKKTDIAKYNANVEALIADAYKKDLDFKKICDDANYKDDKPLREFYKDISTRRDIKLLFEKAKAAAAATATATTTAKDTLKAAQDFEALGKAALEAANAEVAATAGTPAAATANDKLTKAEKILENAKIAKQKAEAAFKAIATGTAASALSDAKSAITSAKSSADTAITPAAYPDLTDKESAFVASYNSQANRAAGASRKILYGVELLAAYKKLYPEFKDDLSENVDEPTLQDLQTVFDKVRDNKYLFASASTDFKKKFKASSAAFIYSKEDKEAKVRSVGRFDLALPKTIEIVSETDKILDKYKILKTNFIDKISQKVIDDLTDPQTPVLKQNEIKALIAKFGEPLGSLIVKRFELDKLMRLRRQVYDVLVEKSKDTKKPLTSALANEMINNEIEKFNKLGDTASIAFLEKFKQLLPTNVTDNLNGTQIHDFFNTTATTKLTLTGGTSITLNEFGIDATELTSYMDTLKRELGKASFSISTDSPVTVANLRDNLLRELTPFDRETKPSITIPDEMITTTEQDIIDTVENGLVLSKDNQTILEKKSSELFNSITQFEESLRTSTDETRKKFLTERITRLTNLRSKYTDAIAKNMAFAKTQTTAGVELPELAANLPTELTGLDNNLNAAAQTYLPVDLKTRMNADLNSQINTFIKDLKDSRDYSSLYTDGNISLNTAKFKDFSKTANAFLYTVDTNGQTGLAQLQKLVNDNAASGSTELTKVALERLFPIMLGKQKVSESLDSINTMEIRAFSEEAFDEDGINVNSGETYLSILTDLDKAIEYKHTYETASSQYLSQVSKIIADATQATQAAQAAAQAAQASQSAQSNPSAQASAAQAAQAAAQAAQAAAQAAQEAQDAQDVLDSTASLSSGVSEYLQATSVDDVEQNSLDIDELNVDIVEKIEDLQRKINSISIDTPKKKMCTQLIQYYQNKKAELNYKKQELYNIAKISTFSEKTDLFDNSGNVKTDGEKKYFKSHINKEIELSRKDYSTHQADLLKELYELKVSDSQYAQKSKEIFDRLNGLKESRKYVESIAVVKGLKKFFENYKNILKANNQQTTDFEKAIDSFDIKTLEDSYKELNVKEINLKMLQNSTQIASLNKDIMDKLKIATKIFEDKPHLCNLGNTTPSGLNANDYETVLAQLLKPSVPSTNISENLDFFKDQAGQIGGGSSQSKKFTKLSKRRKRAQSIRHGLVSRHIKKSRHLRESKPYMTSVEKRKTMRRRK